VFRDDQQKKRQHVALMDYLAANRVTYESASVGEYNVLWGFVPRAVLSREAIEKIREPRDPRVEVGSSPVSEETWT
jgi:hypothetical protein